MPDHLPSGSHPVCPRCGCQAAGVFCDDCGLNLRKQGELPTADAFAARRREERWLAEQREDQAAQGQPETEAARWGRKGQGDLREPSAGRILRRGKTLPLGVALALILLAGAGIAWSLTEWDAPMVGQSPLLSGDESVAAEGAAEPGDGSAVDPQEEIASQRDSGPPVGSADSDGADSEPASVSSDATVASAVELAKDVALAEAGIEESDAGPSRSQEDPAWLLISGFSAHSTTGERFAAWLQLDQDRWVLREFQSVSGDGQMDFDEAPCDIEIAFSHAC